ncbi:MAG: sodium:proton antiporter [Hymenobacteraceae bacterium]|nr:sodium:proton antiporter [Hymenobacteraceae bacterium]
MPALLLLSVIAPAGLVQPWLLLPFLALLLLVAVGPMVLPTLWERHHQTVAIGLGVLMAGWYLGVRGEVATVAATLAEYDAFATTLGCLYVVGGTFYVSVNVRATPGRNVALLAVGAGLASLIGTTGAAILLIRPLLRLNGSRTQPYHVAFFIFIVANAGGLLTPLGDPPLLLGYLRGVPFDWTTRHLWPYWLLANGALLGLFWLRDRLNKRPGGFSAAEEARVLAPGGQAPFTVHGWGNLPLLAVVVGAVVLDPAHLTGLPALRIAGHSLVGLREIVQVGAAGVAYWRTPTQRLRANHFTWAPVREVVILFFGIFLTMMPALQLAASAVSHPGLAAWVRPVPLYWATGLLSAMLDNAPTYANFLTVALARHGGAATDPVQVAAFATAPATAPYLTAIALGAVLFGGMTYIGNGPNLLVRAVAEQEGIAMPSFHGYFIKYALTYLLPVLVVVGGCLLLD